MERILKSSSSSFVLSDLISHIQVEENEINSTSIPEVSAIIYVQNHFNSLAKIQFDNTNRPHVFHLINLFRWVKSILCGIVNFIL